MGNRLRILLGINGFFILILITELLGISLAQGFSESIFKTGNTALLLVFSLIYLALSLSINKANILKFLCILAAIFILAYMSDKTFYAVRAIIGGLEISNSTSIYSGFIIQIFFQIILYVYAINILFLSSLNTQNIVVISIAVLLTMISVVASHLKYVDAQTNGYSRSSTALSDTTDQSRHARLK